MENIKLEYFRLTLTENRQKSLLPQKSRTELIEDLFLNDIEFVSNKNTEYKLSSLLQNLAYYSI